MESNEQFKSLMEMGCDPILSEAAIRKLKSQDLSALLDWIEAHSGEEKQWEEWLCSTGRSESGSIEKKEEAGSGVSVPIESLVKKEQRG